MNLPCKKTPSVSTHIQWLTPDSFHYWQVQGICLHLFPLDQYRLPINAVNESHEHIAALILRGAVVLSGRLVPIPSDCNKRYYHISRLVAVRFYSEPMLHSLLSALIDRAKALGAQGLMVHVKVQSVATYLKLGFIKVIAVYDHIEEQPLQKMFLLLE
ncbi:hypothetical protein [Oceanicoccus sagamiensis]|uniref:N-acetyltransferase domain-containing protein n=1 Tax=Oceanicoccus sagamiensis TaxID=716816 RepID=A0A1X9N911_9GAMM|nr:hypothetical protein [Oceanicoccus sagamiensis]ARN74156.1 hypothetical protein BST96_08500 [Oceanicoccus sagamiensis]